MFWTIQQYIFPAYKLQGSPETKSVSTGIHPYVIFKLLYGQMQLAETAV